MILVQEYWIEMGLLQDWREYAYGEEMQNSKEGQQLWQNYFELEKGILLRVDHPFITKLITKIISYCINEFKE